MDKIIYKYDVTNAYREDVVVMLPLGAMVLDFNMQNKSVFIWVELMSSTDIKTDRKFRIYGTGHAIPRKAMYVNTIHVDGLVWHLYEVTYV